MHVVVGLRDILEYDLETWECGLETRDGGLDCSLALSDADPWDELRALSPEWRAVVNHMITMCCNIVEIT